jgi:cytochrome c oxidase cbb3-type subunit II
MERIATILAIGGLGTFAIAAVLTGYLPVSHLERLEYQTLEEVTEEPSLDFIDLSRRYPEQFKKYYGEPTAESFRRALLLGRDTYIAEACWHCHSQFVRPISNEDQRFGKVSYALEYRNEMFLPHLLGTRRVGPDLIREAGRRGNDWHAAHFYDPRIVSPASVMPRYTWFFDGELPNERGIAMITYMQWLGSWIPASVGRAPVSEEAETKEVEESNG